MPDPFLAAMRRVFAHEGGYVDHPDDPGGATNLGITRRTLADWRGVTPFTALPKSEVRRLTRTEATEIYRARYWQTVQGDALPPGVAYALFDFAVNSGTRRAVRTLQEIVGTTPDGIMGGMTLSAVLRRDSAELVRQLSARRLSFMQRLRHWRHFGRGWTRRVNEVEREALRLSGGGGGW